MFNFNQESYIEFRSIVKERTNPIIAFLGSGLSRQAGLPDWEELKSKLVSGLENKISEISALDPDSARMKSIELSRIKSEEDIWMAFDFIKKALGRTTYTEKIRELIDPSKIDKNPEVYHYLWKLKLSGILSLNIESLASRAHGELFPGKDLPVFTSKEIGQYTHLLKHSIPFIAHLHGMRDNSDSWVFTRSELKALLVDQAYQNFIRSCFSTRTILFVGISAQDIAAGGHLEKLRNWRINTGPHFWITNKGDIDTEKWAEDVGIRIIYYQPDDASHSVLKEILKDISSYMPSEEDVVPVKPVLFDKTPIETLMEPNELATKNPEFVREKLNARAKDIFEKCTKSAYEDYEKFLNEYEEAVHRAWFISTKEGNNSILGYKLQKLIKRGAFGNVYLAENSEGHEIAIKILHYQEIKNKEMLQSFRRGVRSMTILSNHNVYGMVPYIEAYEIPAFIVMNFINGPDLKEAVESRNIKEWDEILKIGLDVSKIIRSAHILPERVLHRDIKPANIMLKDYYINNARIEVVVLDFDLSWHKGGVELSVTSDNTSSGYLAPEQIYRNPNISTRSAAVDSFGFGMTLYFLRTGNDPLLYQHKHKNWEENLFKEVNRNRNPKWVSIPNRFSRLILNSTRDEQSARWDMSQISGELESLYDATLNPEEVVSAELIAEELMARSVGIDRYIWDNENYSGLFETIKGLVVKVTGKESDNSIILNLSWNSKGTSDHRSLFKYIEGYLAKVYSMLKSKGWVIENKRNQRFSFNFTAYIDKTTLMKDIADNARTISHIVELLKLD